MLQCLVLVVVVERIRTRLRVRPGKYTLRQVRAPLIYAGRQILCGITVRRDQWDVKSTGATTAEKLEWTSRGMDADPLSFPPLFLSPFISPPMFHPFRFLLFFPSPIEFSKEVWGSSVSSHTKKVAHTRLPSVGSRS